MKAGLIINTANKHDLEYREYIAGKIRAIGAEVEYLEGDKLEEIDANVLVVIFDGHNLSSIDIARLGWFRRLADESKKFPKRIIVGYQFANGSNDDLKKIGLFDHLAETEINLIYCLKDYIFYFNKNK